MLVLSRKFQEKIRLKDRETGTEVWITVVQTGKDQVRLGFEAPQSIEIQRKEIIERQERREQTERRSQPETEAA